MAHDRKITNILCNYAFKIFFFKTLSFNQIKSPLGDFHSFNKAWAKVFKLYGFVFTYANASSHPWEEAGNLAAGLGAELGKPLVLGSLK